MHLTPGGCVLQDKWITHLYLFVLGWAAVRYHPQKADRALDDDSNKD
jgi:hypothetical protein